MPIDQSWPRTKQFAIKSRITPGDMAVRYWCAAGFYAAIAIAIAFLAHWPWVIVPAALTGYAVVKAFVNGRAA